MILTCIFMCAGLAAKKEESKKKELPQSGLMSFAPHFKKVSIDIEKGDISIDVAEPGEKATISYEQKPFAKHYAFVCEVQEDTLIISFKKRSSWFKISAPTSTINLMVKVPRKVDVSARAGLGFFTINGISGALDCNYGSGTIFSTAPSSSIALKIGTGDVIIDYPAMPKKLCPIALSGSIVKAKVTLPAPARVHTKHGNSSLFAFTNEFAEIKNVKECHFDVGIKADTGSLELNKQK